MMREMQLRDSKRLGAEYCRGGHLSTNPTSIYVICAGRATRGSRLDGLTAKT